jgi:hypothetical protein
MNLFNDYLKNSISKKDSRMETIKILTEQVIVIFKANQSNFIIFIFN